MHGRSVHIMQQVGLFISPLSLSINSAYWKTCNNELTHYVMTNDLWDHKIAIKTWRNTYVLYLWPQVGRTPVSRHGFACKCHSYSFILNPVRLVYGRSGSYWFQCWSVSYVTAVGLITRLDCSPVTRQTNKYHVQVPNENYLDSGRAIFRKF